MSSTASMLDETVERLLSRHFASATRGSVDSASALLAQTMEAGLDLVFVPEDSGGLGAGVLEASAVAYRWGYHAAPLPIVEMLMLRELASLGYLAEDEHAALAVVHNRTIEGSEWSSDIAQTVIAPVTGRDPSTIVLCINNSNDNLVLSGFSAESAVQRFSMAGEPLLVLDLSTAKPSWIRETSVSFVVFSAKGALLTASSIIGMTQRLLETAIEHVNTRQQFGKPLAKFQAIQHQLADAAAEHVVTQAATRSAIAAFDAGRLTPLRWRSAKMQAGRAGTVVASVTHQVLGAIGFTEEHMLHHYSKRLWTLRDSWGHEAELRKSIGTDAAENSDHLWAWMVS